MFKRLKRKSIQKQTDKNLNNRDLSQVNASAKSLGFLVDETSFRDFDKLYSFSKFLEFQPKDVKVFSFVEFKKKAPSLRQDQISNKEFSWDGAISNLNAKEFLNRPFDVLVGYYNGSHEFLDLMVSKSKAKFKVGVASSDDRLFDLLLAIDINDTEGFKIELKKYLNCFK